MKRTPLILAFIFIVLSSMFTESCGASFSLTGSTVEGSSVIQSGWYASLTIRNGGIQCFIISVRTPPDTEKQLLAWSHEKIQGFTWAINPVPATDGNDYPLAVNPAGMLRGTPDPASTQIDWNWGQFQYCHLTNIKVYGGTKSLRVMVLPVWVVSALLAPFDFWRSSL